MDREGIRWWQELLGEFNRRESTIRMAHKGMGLEPDSVGILIPIKSGEVASGADSPRLRLTDPIGMLDRCQGSIAQQESVKTRSDMVQAHDIALRIDPASPGSSCTRHVNRSEI